MRLVSPEQESVQPLAEPEREWGRSQSSRFNRSLNSGLSTRQELFEVLGNSFCHGLLVLAPASLRQVWN
jgi:hypothetical protein